MEYRNKDEPTVYDALATVVKAVGNGRRLELIELLAQGEHSVEVLARKSHCGVTTASAALQTLRGAGLVATRRQGTTVFYRLAGSDVLELYLAAERVALSRSAQVRDALGTYVSQVPGAEAVPLIEPADVTSHMSVVDVRPRVEFESGHFPGAISMPFKHLPERLGELPEDGEVVVYCRGRLCRLAREAAAFLRERGVTAMAMREGVVEWRAKEEHGLGLTA